MSRSLSVALIAVLAGVSVAAGDPAEGLFAGPAAPAAGGMRLLGAANVGTWSVAWMGDDSRVAHCKMSRPEAEGAADTPSMVILADRKWVIMRVSAPAWSFSGNIPLKVILTTADGVSREPLAAAGGPNLADIDFGNDRRRMDELAGSAHLDVTVGETTVRLSLDGLGDTLPAYDACLANIGRPVETWTAAEPVPDRADLTRAPDKP